MKQSTKKNTICFVLFFLSSFFIHAQQFIWAKGGGASTSTDQSVSFMCTDPNGNVYALNIIGGNAPITSDTFHSSLYYGTNDVILITSYNCYGQMRWAKAVGSVDGVIPFGISADSLGHIYIGAEYIHIHGPLYLGYDSTIAGGSYLAEGIIQLDTSGHFNWVRFIGNNTSACFGSLPVYGSPLNCDVNNNVHYFVYAKSGVPIMTSITSVFGVYELVYNASGILLSAVRLDLDSQWFLHGVALDPSTNKLYVFGEVNMGMGAGVDTFFAAAFDASRNRLWWYYPGHGNNDDYISGITLYENKYLHFSGGGQSPTLAPTEFVFNGDSVFNTHFGYYAMSVIMTTDTNGHPLKITKFDGSLSVSGLGAITQLPYNKVAATGIFAGEVICGRNNIITPAGEGQNPFLVIVDSAGDLETIQQIHGDGFYDAGYSITSDRVGNVYVGGQVVDSIWAGTPHIPAYHSVGGATNFFVMKYGVDCSCTSMPIASAYTDTGTHTVGFTYTGSTTGIDSIEWNFDDGSTATGASVIHTYSMIGTYRACVTIYTPCGSDLYCKDVVVRIPSLVVSNQSALSEVKVFPNPVNNELNISGIIEKTTFIITSLTGQIMQDGYVKPGTKKINLAKFPTGIYILELTGESGMRSIVRVVKD